MRHCIFCVLLFAACGTTGGQPDGGPIPTTRVVFQQYYQGSPVFILESLGDRDAVKLRSEPAEKGQVKPAYVPDSVMMELLAQFRKLGFYDHATARPRDPRKAGGRAELTVIGQGRHKDYKGRPIEAFIRRANQGRGAHETYNECVETFRAVHAHYAKFQAAAGGGEFGVKKAEFKRPAIGTE